MLRNVNSDTANIQSINTKCIWPSAEYINEVLHENSTLDDSRPGKLATAGGAAGGSNPPDDWDDGLTFTAKPTCKCTGFVPVCVLYPCHDHPPTTTIT